MSVPNSEINTNIALAKNNSGADYIKPGTTIKPRWLDNKNKKIMLKQFSLITKGELCINDDGHEYYFGNKTDDCNLSVTINVLDSRFYADMCFGGSIGASEAYMYGYWSTSNLTDLVRIFSRNKDALDTIEGGLAYITLPIQKILHWFNRNTQQGSRRILLHIMISVTSCLKLCLMKP